MIHIDASTFIDIFYGLKGDVANLALKFKSYL